MLSVCSLKWALARKPRKGERKVRMSRVWFRVLFLGPVALFLMACSKNSPPVTQNPPVVSEDEDMNFGTVQIGAVEEVPEGSDVFPKLEVNCDYLATQNAKFIDVEVVADLSGLSEGERKALPHLIEAADEMDNIFWQQSDRQGYDMYMDLVEASLDTGLSECDENLLRLMDIMYGRFDRLEENACFVGNFEKPKGAGFYPETLTKEQYEEMLGRLKDPNFKSLLQSPYTLIEVNPCLSVDGSEISENSECLRGIPYNEVYEANLLSAAGHLRKAADLVENQSLTDYLKGRAQNFLDNKYPESDALWVGVEGSGVQVTVGPYEVYEDLFKSQKAAYTAFIAAVNKKKTVQLEHVKAFLEEMEAELPLKAEHRGYKRATASPIYALDLIYSAGDTRAAQQTLAYNLPNDENVREQKGSRKDMFMNIIAVKYHKILLPIAQSILRKELAHVTEESFLWHVVLHELAHGMGPGKIKVNGEEITVGKALVELYPSIEEAKADVMGLWMVNFLEKKGFDAVGTFQEAMTTQLASAFRSIRFGKGQAHGNANTILYTWMMEHGVYTWDRGEFFVDITGAEKAITELLAVILEIEATGDYERAKKLLDLYTNPDSVNPEQTSQVHGALMMIDLIVDESINHVPVDFRPFYVTAEGLTTQSFIGSSTQVKDGNGGVIGGGPSFKVIQ